MINDKNNSQISEEMVKVAKRFDKDMQKFRKLEGIDVPDTVTINGVKVNREEVVSKFDWHNRETVEQFAKYDCDRDNAKTGELKYTDCSKCKNKGIIFIYKINGTAEQGYDYEIIPTNCSCMETRAFNEEIIKNGWGKNLEKTLEEFEITNSTNKYLKELTEKYLKSDKKKWVAMFGQTSSGKSHVCSVIANSFIKQNIPTLYVSWNKYADTIKELIAKEGGYGDYFNKYAKVQVLYIDDFFKNKYTETDLRYAYDLINYREAEELITIISGERRFEELIQIDQGLISRIKGMCGDYFVDIEPDISKNYRLQNIKKI